MQPGKGWRLGVLICYDNNVNENGRITALLGADIILAPHQTGGCRTRNPICWEISNGTCGTTAGSAGGN